jgi:hypothetical protein
MTLGFEGESDEHAYVSVRFSRTISSLHMTPPKVAASVHIPGSGTS